MNRWLEIGPGEARLPGDWTTLDAVAREGIVDHVCRWGSERLPFPDESLELIYAGHVLEHIPWYQTLDALREAARVLAPGGRVEIHVPDFDVLARAAGAQACLDDHCEEGRNSRLHWMHWVAERLFHLGPERQWHRACFNADHLTWCLQEAGFVQISRIAQERGNSHGVINLGMTALKPGAVSPAAKADVMHPAAGPREVVPPFIEARVDARLVEPQPKVVPGAEDLEPCHSRREFDAAAKIFFCAHPNVHLPGQLATSEICRRCTRWREPAPDEFRLYANHAGVVRKGPCWFQGDQIGLRQCDSCRGRVQIKVFECRHPDHESTTVDECLHCGDYEQRLTAGGVTKWAVGVTTAPRTVPTLARTLVSLRHAGWREVRLFAEPGSRLPELPVTCDVSVTRRESTLGEWPNWYLGLAELYQRDPLADAYLMVQDDVVFCANLRPFLESTVWPAERLAVVSLYYPLPGDDSSAEPAYRVLTTKGGLPGALALAFPNLAARLLLSDRRVVSHRRRGPSQALRLTDVVVGEWAERMQLPAFGYSPSLCQHIGQTSTVWSEEQDRSTREATSFPGEAYDALELLGPQHDMHSTECQALVSSG